jgi:hypothetical protein
MEPLITQIHADKKSKLAKISAISGSKFFLFSFMQIRHQRQEKECEESAMKGELTAIIEKAPEGATGHIALKSQVPTDRASLWTKQRKALSRLLC